MKNGFSLVEILVAISMLLVMSVGSLVFINNFNSKKDLDLSRSALVSNLRLARSFAAGRQLPAGASGELDFVRVRLNKDGTMIVVASKIGGGTNQFFSKVIFEPGVESAATVANYLGFRAYKANLTDINGIGRTESYTIVLQSVRGVEETRTVVIEPSGVIK